MASYMRWYFRLEFGEVTFYISLLNSNNQEIIIVGHTNGRSRWLGVSPWREVNGIIGYHSLSVHIPTSIWTTSSI